MLDPSSTGPVDCDEYPLYSQEEGGRLDSAFREPPGVPQRASLQLLNSSENRREGALVGYFVNACNLTAGPRGDDKRKYLMVPLATPGPGLSDRATTPATAAWCGFDDN